MNSLEVFAINHILRHKNKEANDLANRTLDLVRHINYAQTCQLLIKLDQTDNENNDILYIQRLLDILRDFTGSDRIVLGVRSEDKYISIKLSNMSVNYCHELRVKLKDLLGKRRIIVKQLI